MPEAGPAVASALGAEAAVLSGARTLAQAISGSPPFLAFEAARRVLVADAELLGRVRRYRSRERELAPLRAQGGADPREEEALAAEFGDAWQRYRERVPAWVPPLLPTSSRR